MNYKEIKIFKNLGLVLMGRAMLSKTLIHFSVNGWCCVPSLLFHLRPNCGGHDEDNGDLLQKLPVLVDVMKIMVTFFKHSQCP